VPQLKRSVILVSIIENKGYEVLFRDGHAHIIPIGYSSNKATLFGVRERYLYRIKGQPMRENSSNIVA
jgi:hypothetical protein